MIALVAVAGAIASADARAEHTRVTNPNALSVELFGRGMLYGVYFDRVVADDLAVGVGYGGTPLNTLGGFNTEMSTGLVPVYMNYYFMRSGGSFFATVGADLVTHHEEAEGRKATYSELEFSSTPVVPTFGVGFETRADAGFLFRVAGYGLVGNRLAPWFGFSMGYSF